MIERTEAYFTSNNPRYRVRTLIWADSEAAPAGVVQLVHGVCEHIGRYDEFARFLAANGFVVCGNDHLGHGKTAASESDLGYVEPGDHVNMVRDMNQLYKIMRKRYPEIPYFMFGHSMGSFLARIYTAHFAEDLAGAVFCGTGQLPAAVTALDDPVNALLDRLPPTIAFGDFSNRLLGKVTKRLLKDTDDIAWISKSEANRAAYREDPLIARNLSNELARELVALAVKASLPATVAAIPPMFPVMLISGGKDPVGMFGSGVISFADRLMENGVLPEVILYPGDRHEILNEEDRDKVFADVLAFLKDCMEG